MAGPKDVAAHARALYEHFRPQERHALMLEAMARKDEAEALRLKDSCPTRDYRQTDAEFVDRRETAMTIMLTVSVDLRSMWGKLHMLQLGIWAARDLAVWQQINATMAFLDGEQLGKGLPQTEFFAPQEQEDEQDDEEEDDEEDPASDEPKEGAAAAMVREALSTGGPDLDAMRRSKRERGELARRMSAVEDRTQQATDRVLGPLVGASLLVAQDLAEVWAGFGEFCRSRIGVTPQVLMRAWEFPLLADIEQILADYPLITPRPEKVADYARCCCTPWDRRFGGPYADAAEDDDGGEQ